MSGKKDEGKTPVVSTIIAALCVMLYIGGLSYGALSIYNSVIDRRALADREFDNIADLVSAAGVLGFMDEPFIKTIQDSIDGSQTLLGVVITSSQGEFAFERERGTVITWVNDSPRFIPRFAVSNPPKYLPLRVEGQRNVNIQAVSGYIDYDYCIGVLKKTLMVVLSALVLAFFTLLMDTLLIKNREPVPREMPQGAYKKPATENSGETPVKAPDSAVQAEEPQDPPAETQVPDDWMPPDDAGTDSDDNDDNDNNDDNDTDELPDFDLTDNDDNDDELPGFDLTDDDELPDSDQKTPQGLFSPRSGTGWEAYTNDRLDSELHRCASTEQDLALIVAVVKEPAKLDAEQFQLFCREAVQYFEHRDLIFEYQDQGISVICPGFSLEQAFAASEEFNNRVLGQLSRPAGSKVDFRFGISSRSGRLIDAGQISFEAAEALKKAVDDRESHIVAFKSDPEKYRHYITRRH
ncbi:MAG: hypothetical protein LBD96_06980 [Treponema sp.]|jgi:hypothetical protein|nr:hypothetical protein [Treponema sp.]